MDGRNDLGADNRKEKWEFNGVNKKAISAFPFHKSELAISQPTFPDFFSYRQIPRIVQVFFFRLETRSKIAATATATTAP